MSKTKFEINISINNVTLTVSEPAPVTEDRTKPYLYKQNIKCSFEEEAKYYIKANKDFYN